MKKKWSSVLALGCNVLNIIFTAYAVLSFFWKPTTGFMHVSGASCFRYFTIDSNVFCAVGSLVVLPHCLAVLRGRRTTLPRWCSLLRFSGTAAVTVTLLTVAFFLGPTMGYAGMFSGASFFLHGIDPLLAIVSFCLLEPQEPLPYRKAWLGVAPVVAYACVYLPLVVFSDIWPDFYGFNRDGRWFVSAPLMLLAATVISLALLLAQRTFSRGQAPVPPPPKKIDARMSEKL